MKLASVVATLMAIVPQATGTANTSRPREHQQERDGEWSHRNTEYDGGSKERRTNLRRGRVLGMEAMSIGMSMQPDREDRRLKGIGSLPLTEAAFSIEFAAEDNGKGPKPKPAAAGKARKLRPEDSLISRRRLTDDAESFGSVPLTEAAFSVEFAAEDNGKGQKEKPAAAGKARKLRPEDSVINGRRLTVDGEADGSLPLTEAAFSVEFAAEDNGKGPKPKPAAAGKARKLRHEDSVISRRRLTDDAEVDGSLPLTEAAFSVEFAAEDNGKGQKEQPAAAGKARKLRPEDSVISRRRLTVDEEADGSLPLTEAAFSVEFAAEDNGKGPKPKPAAAGKARKLRPEDSVISRRRLTEDEEAFGSVPLTKAAFSLEFALEESGKGPKPKPAAAGKARKLRHEDSVINGRRLTVDGEADGSLPLTEAAFSVEFAAENNGNGPKPKPAAAGKARKLRPEDSVISRRRLTEDAEAFGSVPLTEAAFSLEFASEESGKGPKPKPAAAGKARKLRLEDSVINSRRLTEDEESFGSLPLTEAAFSVAFAAEESGKGPKPKPAAAGKARKLTT